MRTRRGLGPRHTAPVHRQAGVLAGDSTAVEPIRVGRNGAYELGYDETLELDDQGRLRVAPAAGLAASDLAGDGLEAKDGKLRVRMAIRKLGQTASGTYVQAEAQAVVDKLDELIGLVQDDISRR